MILGLKINTIPKLKLIKQDQSSEWRFPHISQLRKDRSNWGEPGRTKER